MLTGAYYAVAAGVSLLLTVGLVLLVVVLVRRTSLRTRPVLVGVLTFAVSQLLLRIPLVGAVTGLAGDLVTAHPFWWLVVLCLSAGVFEEGARALGFRHLLGGEPDRPATPVAAGLGHGGLEAFVLVGVGVGVTALTMAFLVSDPGALAALPPEARTALEAQRDALAAVGALGQLAALWERAVTLVVHVALSVLVFRAVRDRRRAWLVLAVLLHAGFNGGVAWFQQTTAAPTTGSVWLVELVLTVAGAAVVLVVWRVVRRSAWARPPTPAR